MSEDKGQAVGVAMTPEGRVAVLTRELDTAIALSACLRPIIALEDELAKLKGRDRLTPKGHPDRRIPHTRVDGLWAFTQVGEVWRNHLPPGGSARYLPIYGRPTWSAYTRAAALVRDRLRARYWWIQEDDVYVPRETLRTCYRILEEDPTIGAVCAPYWWRHGVFEPDQPAIPVSDFPHIYPAEGAGPWFTYPQDRTFDVDAAGLGATMVRVDILDPEGHAGHPPLERPLFAEHFTNRFGTEARGGDLCFFSRIRKAGWRVVVAPWLRCWHRDHCTGWWYPFSQATRQKYGWDEVPYASLWASPVEDPGAALLFEWGIDMKETGPIGNCGLCDAKVTPAGWERHLLEQHPDLSAEARAAALKAIVDRAGQAVSLAPPTAAAPLEAPPPAPPAPPAGEAGPAIAPPTTRLRTMTQLLSTDRLASAPGRPHALAVGWGGVGIIGRPDGQAFGWELNDLHQFGGDTTPDLVGPVQEVLTKRPLGYYALIYWSHGPEHLSAAALPGVLQALWDRVQAGGELDLRCPDGERLRALVAAGTPEDLVLYDSPQGPITLGQCLHGRADYTGDSHAQVLDGPQLEALARALAPAPQSVAITKALAAYGVRASCRKPGAIPAMAQ